MSSIPLPALHAATYQAPDVMDQYSKILQIKQLLGQGQMQQQALQGAQLENQQRQMDISSQQALMKAYQESDGDLNKTLPLAAKYGARPDALIKLRQSAIDQQKANIELLNAKGARALQEADMMRGAWDQVNASPNKAQAYQQAVSALQQAGVDVSQVPPQYPGDEQFSMMGIGLRSHEKQLADLAKQVQMQKDQAQAANAEAELPAKVAESQIKQQDASLSPMERSLKNQNALEYYAAKGDPMAQAALQKKIEVAKASRPVINNTTGGDIKDVAQAIYQGQASPILTDYSFRDRTAIAAELKRLGYDSVKASMDYKAVQKQIQTLNGPQQTRLRQSITSANDMIDKVETLYNEWKQVGSSSGMKMFNRASLAAAKQMPGRPGAVAQALDAQISDLVADLGNIYMGGNSPTDHALSLAAKSFQSDWNDDTMREALKQARANVKIRANSIANTQPAGVSEDSPYLNKSGKQPNQQPKNDPLGVL